MLAKRYGSPDHNLVVEPFAGSACFSLYWEPKRVLLVDCNPVIASLWRYLINVSRDEILGLPLDFDLIDDLKICEEAKHLIGFWCNKGTSTPHKQRSAWARQYRDSPDCKVWGAAARARVAEQVEKIRHWEVRCSSYDQIDDREATWFFDPPYFGLKQYPFSDINYVDLAYYCTRCTGTVIICENEGADWFEFTSLHNARGTFGRYRSGRSAEVYARFESAL